MNADTLLDLGFRDIGAWVMAKTGSGLDYYLDDANADGNRPLLDGRSALYAFVQDGDVLYIGKTARTVRVRFAGYKSPSRGQRTNWRCNGKIRERLNSGATVRILVFAMTAHLAHLRYSDFSINLAAGLEDSLIEEFDPPWNGRDSSGPMTEDAERDRDEAVGAEVPSAAPALPPAPATSFSAPLSGSRASRSSSERPTITTASSTPGSMQAPILATMTTRSASILAAWTRRSSRVLTARRTPRER